MQKGCFSRLILHILIQGILGFACANMGQRWLKMVLNNLFEH